MPLSQNYDRSGKAPGAVPSLQDLNALRYQIGQTEKLIQQLRKSPKPDQEALNLSQRYLAFLLNQAAGAQGKTAPYPRAMGGRANPSLGTRNGTGRPSPAPLDSPIIPGEWQLSASEKLNPTLRQWSADTAKAVLAGASTEAAVAGLVQKLRSYRQAQKGHVVLGRTPAGPKPKVIVRQNDDANGARTGTTPGGSTGNLAPIPLDAIVRRNVNLAIQRQAAAEQAAKAAADRAERHRIAQQYRQRIQKEKEDEARGVFDTTNVGDQAAAHPDWSITHKYVYEDPGGSLKFQNKVNRLQQRSTDYMADILAGPAGALPGVGAVLHSILSVPAGMTTRSLLAPLHGLAEFGTATDPGRSPWEQAGAVANGATEAFSPMLISGGSKLMKKGYEAFQEGRASARATRPPVGTRLNESLSPAPSDGGKGATGLDQEQVRTNPQAGSPEKTAQTEAYEFGESKTSNKRGFGLRQYAVQASPPTFKQIRDFVGLVLSDGKARVMAPYRVSQKTASVLNDLGVRMNDPIRQLRSNFIMHVNNYHTTSSTIRPVKGLRDELPITPVDLALLDEVTAAPDYAMVAKNGHIVYAKWVNKKQLKEVAKEGKHVPKGHLIVVEEQLSGDVLSPVSMKKFKTPVKEYRNLFNSPYER